MSSTNPQSFFENRLFRPRIAPKTCRRHGARELLVLDGGLAEAGCSAVWLLGSASTAHAEAQGGWPASTVLRLLSSAALKRPKPRCAAILAAMAWTAKRMPLGAKPQSVEGGRRSQHAQTNHSQPACKLQVRADSRDCSYRQAWLSADPCGQAQQARRPSTQTSKHLAAQHSSVSERQDKEAACGPHPGMDSIAYRWYRGVEGPVFSRPVLHRKSVCGTI